MSPSLIVCKTSRGALSSRELELQKIMKVDIEVEWSPPKGLITVAVVENTSSSLTPPAASEVHL